MGETNRISGHPCERVKICQSGAIATVVECGTCRADGSGGLLGVVNDFRVIEQARG